MIKFLVWKVKIYINKLNFLDIENIPLEELDFADSDICLVEYSKEDNWIFNYEKKEYKQGKCDWCNSYKYLIFMCNCNEVIKINRKYKNFIFNNFKDWLLYAKMPIK